ncbi:arsenical pump-driving ATPase [Wohlfahrtiimonas chitiniclastica]|uniref:arsenical pump-driving ATPase n=1 Tax=Wohlfahrtiimonas chitiniclastica TaxID=400946 RepID=UPI000B98277D|nr:arsenical pump-driving ATPase [Wohlfahrtiimonas chitiniclastica]MBS7815693.1 arsenical pump-driving ATPase [Wohlfahrtiimonas chitiniclastica]OYQ85890.1 arsenical pump-driving ATPase [Wohlfahrtiimonas chitiniclastica]
MKFLENAPSFLFFTGKGGVGKTSIACATALYLAKQGKNTLIVSTDPASNIAQVFGQKIGSDITNIVAVDNLSGIELSPTDAVAEYKKKIIDPVKDILPADVIASIEEQLSGACTTEIAAFDEFTGILTNKELLAQFDHVVFDTAPTGHTIRMLQLPGAWTDFITDNQSGTSCLGPLAGLEKQQAQYKDAVDVLSDGQQTRLVLVSRAQKTALFEAARTSEELSKIGIQNQFLVVNGILAQSQVGNDALAQAIYTREQESLNNIPTQLKNITTDYLDLKPFNLVGLEAISQLFESVETDATIDNSAIIHPNYPGLSDLVDELSQKKTGLIMLMGKGGVGKTTMAAAIALRLAENGVDVHLSTSDPAAHLANIVDTTVDHLTVSRIDPKQEIENYKNFVIETSGKGMSADELMVLEEDLRSPCTEEIAVFQAFSKVINEANGKVVVMDTAPTGHTLLLLDATGAYHKEVVKQMEKQNIHQTTPMMHLQDENYTKMILVTLAENTPVSEAEHLQEDLKRAGITPWAWIVNNSIAASKTESQLLMQRAKNEIKQIDLVINKLSQRSAVVPLLADEPIGVNNLRKLFN